MRLSAQIPQQKHKRGSDMKHTIIRAALLCGALAISTSAFAQVGGAIGATSAAGVSHGATSSAANATGQIATPAASANGTVHTGTSTTPLGTSTDMNTGVKTHTATPAKSLSNCDPREATRIPCHKATPTTDTKIDTGVSTPNASSSTGANATTTPNGANANTSTSTGVSTPKPH
jgi:hypothetical protein